MKFNNQKLRNYDPGVGEELLEDRTRLWISVLLSQARGPIPAADLLDMLPPEVREDRAYAMSAIRHLYRSLETLEIGHDTLKDFLLKSYAQYMQAGNELLLEFCRQYPDHSYSVANTLYHDALSAYPLNAVLDCTQDWADRAAQAHVNADWVMQDVKKAVELAVEMQLPAESLRLALLLKRLNVRYRTVFVEFKEEIATALIAQKKFGPALKYLSHENGLKVSPDQAFHFLGQLYAHGAWEQAAQLRTSIDRHYRSELDDSLRSALYYAAMEARTPWMAPVFAPDPCTYPDMEWSSEKTIQLIWDHCVAWNDPVILTYAELLSRGDDLQDLLDCAEDLSRTASYARSALEFGRFFGEGHFRNFPVTALQQTMAGNLAAMIQTNGAPQTIDDLEPVIMLLLLHGSDVPVIRKLLITLQASEVPHSLWTSNRVDLNMISYDRLCLAALSAGFLHEGSVSEVSAKSWHQKSWETDLKQLIHEIHFLEGSAYRQQADGDLNSEDLSKCFTLLLQSMKFSLNSRSQWERSYQLPEQVFPLLYKKMVSFANRFLPEALPAMLRSVSEGAGDQLGLYSEGFRNVMAQTVRELVGSTVEKETTLRLLELWQEHVLSGVMNRWERCEEMLDITECYGIYNENEKAAYSWRKMLESSMGPFWRTESQFGLITAALKNFRTASGSTYQRFAALLDYASGEMCYPNSVKRYKEQLAGILTLTGTPQKASDYYRFETLPTPEVVLMNAESSNFDAPNRGAGYRLGAANLREYGALMEMLGHLDCSPYLKWALCTLFVPAETTQQSMQVYGNHMAAILNELEPISNSNINLISKEWTEWLSQNMERKALRKLAAVLVNHLSHSNLRRIESFITDLDPITMVDADGPQRSVGVIYPLPGVNCPDAVCKKSVPNSCTNWIHYLLHTSDGYGFNTRELCAGLEQLLNVDANTLPAEDLLEIISGHFEYLIQPDEATFKKYSWLQAADYSISGNQTAIQLLIWHLNHPDHAVSVRAEERLIRMVSFVPETVQDLFLHCAGDTPEYASELCSAVIYQSSVRNASLIGEILREYPALITKAAGILHLSIRKNLLDTGVELERAGYPELLDAVNSNLQETSVQYGPPYVPHLSMASLQDVLDDLQSAHFLDQRFSENLVVLMEEYCFPLTQNMVKMSDWYVRRSFNREQWLMGNYDYFLKHALNNAVAHKITRGNIELVYDIVND